MDEQGYRFGVGVLVVASLVIAIILILFFGAAPNLFAERYTVTIRFDAAPGVTSDTPVQKSGVQIGRVKSVKLLDEDGVDLTLELDSQYKVRAKELPRIGTGSIITGDAVVEFIPPTQESLISRFDGSGGSLEDGTLDNAEMQLASAYIQDGDFLSGGRVADDPLDALLNMQESFNTTLGSFQNAGDEVSALARDIRTVIGGGNGEIRKISEQAEQTIANFNETFTNFNATLNAIQRVVGNPEIENTINTISKRLPGLADETETAIQQAGTALAALERTAVSFEEVGVTAQSALADVGDKVGNTLDEVGDAVSGISTTIDNVNDFTAQLPEQGEQVVNQALGTMRNLDSLMADLRVLSGSVNQVANRINRGQGTFAKLVDDPQLYYTLVNTLQNIETVTRRLQPIIEDARVASDKIARDPSSIIDIRGAVFGRPRGGGIK